MLQLFHNPLFRHVVILLAIIGLIVYCVDKSRQNKRTRNTLYNCIYVLYAGAVVKALQVIEAVRGPWHFFFNQLTGLLFVAVGILVYWRWFHKQKDIPYNSFFWMLGWFSLIIALVLQLGFVVLAHAQL